MTQREFEIEFNFRLVLIYGWKDTFVTHCLGTFQRHMN